MTGPDALLAAVLAAPDDDLPRLVFADWCDDHGDPDRADLIRVQSARAALPAHDPTRERLRDREDALIRLGHDRWKVADIRGVQKFVRGFVESWFGTADWLLAAAGPLFATAPVRELRIRNAGGFVARLAKLPELARVESLDLYGNGLAGGDQLGRLLAEAPLDRLRGLNVGNNGLSLVLDLPQLVDSPVAARLTRLDLSGNPLGYPSADNAIGALAATGGLPNLRELSIRHNEQAAAAALHPAGAEVLARSDRFGHLRRLDLSGHRVGTAGLLAVLTGPLSARLTHLDVSNNEVGRDGGRWGSRVIELAGRRRPRLRHLSLGGRRNRVGKPDAADLLGWVGAGDGRTLDLRGGRLAVAAAAAVLGSPHRSRVRLDPPPLEAHMTAGLFVSFALAAGPATVAVADRDPPAELADPVRAALDRKAVTVTEAGEPAVTVWFRDVLPLAASAEQVANGVGVRELQPGGLVGAVRLHRAFTDYRKQSLPAGAYTLRFAVQPEVGDHAGTSPHPEFVLLTPAAADNGVSAVEPADLLGRSRKATGGDHPAVLLLVPAGGATDEPKLVEKADGVRVLLLRRPAAADGAPAKLNLGLVVAGSSPTR